MKIKLIVPFIFLIGLIYGCNKITHSDFELNKYEYAAGESLDYTNLKPKKNQVWTLSDQNNVAVDTFVGKYPQIVLPLLMPDGVYQLTVYDNDKELRREIGNEKTFLIKSERSQLKIKRSGSGNKAFEVTMDNQEIGKSTYLGELIVNIPKGLRFIRIVSNETLVKEETFYVTGNGSQTYYFN